MQMNLFEPSDEEDTASTRVIRPPNDKQRNTPLSYKEAQARLEPFGFRITGRDPASKVTINALIDVECAAGHKQTRRYGDLRQRGCAECNAPFGERLLYALLRHYAVGTDDWRVKAVTGLDPDNLARRLLFDAASESRKIAIENHSAYHDPDQNTPFFRQNISAEERDRLDALKEARETDGIHRLGPMAGWRVTTVRFDGQRIQELVREHGTYLPRVIQEFKKAAHAVGLLLRDDGAEIDADTLYHGLARDNLSGIRPGFELISEWRGRAQEHLWRHTCGGQFSALILDLEPGANKVTGCPFCDRDGNAGRWLDFLERMKRHGYDFAGANRHEIRTEHQTIPLRCSSHPAETVPERTRSKLYQWLHTLRPGSKKTVPPPCPECAKIRKAQVNIEAEGRSEKARQALDERLKSFGFTLVSKGPSTVRDSETGKVIPQANDIRCLHCNHVRSVFVPQVLAKAKKRGAMGCPICRPLPRGPASGRKKI